MFKTCVPHLSIESLFRRTFGINIIQVSLNRETMVMLPSKNPAIPQQPWPWHLRLNLGTPQGYSNADANDQHILALKDEGPGAQKNGGFLKWRYPNSWRVDSGKSYEIG